MTNVYKEAGERILLVRIMRGYTRAALAEIASNSSKYLYEIKQEKKDFQLLCCIIYVNC